MLVKTVKYALVFSFLCCAKVMPQNSGNNSKIGIERVVGCLKSDTSISCLTDQASEVIEHSMNETVTLFGVKLTRNEKIPNKLEAKSKRGSDRFLKAISNFLQTHSISVNFTDEDEKPSPRKGEGVGLFNMNTKALRREKKYYQYAFMVLLGIFGLTGPLVMQVLGVMAAKSLLAAKTALIIVGSVALKKLFDNGGDKSPKVKVVTLPMRKEEYDSGEDHDRWGYGYNHLPYGAGGGPFSSHYGGGQKTKANRS